MALFGTKKTKADDKAEDKVAATPAPVKKSAPKTAPAEAASMKDLYGAGATVKKTSSSKKGSVSKYPLAYSILIKPLVTEKATNLGAHNQYVFMVAKNANKIEIAKAINAVYNVKPTSVNLINMKGKKVSRGKVTGSRKDWKKAIVTLAAGQTIQVYEGV